MDLDPQTILQQLNAAAPDRVDALRQLKNDVVGDYQKKVLWVQHGLVPHLVRCIDTVTTDDDNIDDDDDVADDAAACLRALELLASFANAGPAFLSPLSAAGVLPVVLGESCLQSERPSIVLAALRLIKNIAVATTYASTSSPTAPFCLADTIFTDPYLPCLHRILSPEALHSDTEESITIVAYLIRTLCSEERHQAMLVEHRILDTLATRLATFAIADGYVLPKAEVRARVEGLESFIPKPPMPSGRLDEILGAIAAIITDSPFRVCKFVYSPSILAIFPNTNPGGDGGQNADAPPQLIVLPSIRPAKPRGSGSMDSIMDLLLPETPFFSRTQGNRGGFSPLSTQTTNSRPSSKLQTSLVSWTPPEETTMRKVDPVGDIETPLVPWLIHLVRSRAGAEVLTAASVLASLYKTGFVFKTRERSMGLLVVPVLLDLIDSPETKIKELGTSYTRRDRKMRPNVIEESPAVLARLITDSEPMQKAAIECGAVNKICKLLKMSYDTPLSAPEPPPWSPYNGDRVGVTGSLAAECRLGDEGLHPQLIHHRRVRESTLRAIGALAASKEDFRKAIADEQVIPYIIDSLHPSVGSSKRTKDQGVSQRGSSPNKAPEPELNPVSVMVMACYAIRMLSRSVSTLRTALVDHNASEPLFLLLRHSDVEVQNAATACMCNLLMDFSPLKRRLVEAGVTKILCEHAHSHDARLRLNALWSLKHLVDSASVDQKKRCVEELESGWLVRLIDDTEDDAIFSAKARPDQPSPLATPDVMDEDVDMSFADEHNRPWLASSLQKTTSITPKSDIRILQLAEQQLEKLKENEQDPARKARLDDQAIQEQGLGFIRNLIGGANSSNSRESSNDTMDMIDYLLTTLGQDRLFGILLRKLKPRTLNPYGRRGPGGNVSRIIPPPAKVIEAAIFVLVHMAASIPRHRQLVVAQTAMLRQLVKLSNDPDREVRAAVCHLINNLTWQDDMGDASACLQRATELKNLGFLSRLEALSQNDDEMDVRERAKSALWQMKQGHYAQ
ncbi:armadillo repeat protein [Astrocystis sublimbata]|nr:armadillo repeat protein [Astrocystis sublimbata]